jgi:predicted outer membrane repeat protein
LVSIVILTVVIGAALEGQVTRYVSVTGDDLAGGNTCGDESSPCRTIGQAISVSSGGDVVIIAAGAYTESIAIDKALSLQGAGRGITIIQAHAAAGSASNRVIEITDVSGAEISGLTIRHGVMDGGPFVGIGGGIASLNSSLVLEEVAVTDNSAESQGGGIFSDGGAIVLNDVIIRGNAAVQGGGLWTRDNSPELMDVVFEDNAANGSGGGGMFAGDANPTLTNVIFARNKTPLMLGGGGGMRNAATTAELVNVQFIGNESQLGGGMYNTGESVITMTDVLFMENEAGSRGRGFVDLAEHGHHEQRHIG